MQRDAYFSEVYAALRTKGHRHGRALRTIGDRFLRILVAMLRDRISMIPAGCLVSRSYKGGRKFEKFGLTNGRKSHGWVTGDDELGRHTRFRHALRERGERYVLGVPCTTIRDLEAPLPRVSGRGRPPKAPWQSVTLATSTPPRGVDALDGARRGERASGDRDGHSPRADPVGTQTDGARGVAGGHPSSALGRPHFGGETSPEATEQDGRYGYRYYLTPTYVAEVELQKPSLPELARVIKAGTCIEIYQSCNLHKTLFWEKIDSCVAKPPNKSRISR